MKAERAREQGDPPAAQIYLAGRTGKRPRLIPYAHGLLPPPQVGRHFCRCRRRLVDMMEGVFLEAQNLVDDVACVAPSEAFEEEGMITDTNGETWTAIGMSRTAAHAAAWLPDAPEALDDIGTDRLEFRVMFGCSTRHERSPG
jgi:hypothetical protein